jgi:hypothetical protein
MLLARASQLRIEKRPCSRHREAALAAVAIQEKMRSQAMDCFAALAMTT